ncbi:MAG: hypothetical protein K6G42_00670 [Lachnospiraceae bacterium]|nr:hypothetical protein [Lachnospiraceae bacterium]
MTLNEKAKDLRTSGYALTICGAVGVIFAILVFTGVIPLALNGVFGIVTKTVMSVLFVIFLIAGLNALKRSRIVMEDAERETDKKNDIKKWFAETYDGAAVDAFLEPGLEDNELYFARTDLIKDKICERFMDVEDALMSEITEELYTELFEKEQ